ncbi:MAG: glycosyltransferase family 87 protein [Nostocoides sp.]
MPDRALASVGGPLGRYARRPSWRSAVWPFVALAAVPMQLAMIERAFCIEHGWIGQDMFSRACFSDLPVQFTTGKLSGGFAAYVEGLAHVDQPVVTGAVMSVLGGIAGPGAVTSSQRSYFFIWAVVATLLVMATAWFSAASRPRTAGIVAAVALSPLLVTAVMVGPDIVGVTLVAAGMWAWARRRPALAGALLGVAVMARTYPLLVIAALVLLALRAGRLDRLRSLLGAAGVAAAGIALVFGVAHHQTLTAAYRTWWSSPPGFGSPWFVPQLATSAGPTTTAPPVIRAVARIVDAILAHPVPVGAATALAVLGMVLALVAGFVLALGARRRPTWAEVSLVMVGIALVTGKSVPVQASLWLLPLAALAGIRWRDQFIWIGTEVVHFIAVWLYAGGLARPDRGLPAGWYSLFLVLRLAGIGWLVVCAWRQANARPAHDPDPGWPEDPARDDVVDELSGLLTGEPDRVIAVYG